MGDEEGRLVLLRSRYNRDRRFRALVDYFRGLIDRKEYPAADLAAALELARRPAAPATKGALTDG